MPPGPGHMISSGPPGPPVHSMSGMGPNQGGQMNQSGGPIGPPGPPSIPGQENLNALQKAIDSMKEKGLQEDPTYSQLLALRARQGNMGDK